MTNELTKTNPFNMDFLDWLYSPNKTNILSDAAKLFDNNIASHKLVAEDGKLLLEVVVTGHSPENLKVKYCEKTHTLKVEDVNDTEEHANRSGKEKPWYYNEINLEFNVPETINKKSFTKNIEKGLLTVTALYEEQPKAEADEFEI